MTDFEISAESSGLSSEVSSGVSTPISSNMSSLSLRSSILSQKELQPVTHVLDLPSLKSRPAATSLLSILNKYSNNPGKNFVVDNNNEQAPEGFIDWVIRLVSSGLEWIGDDDLREQIWDSASKRIAERCGRTAAPSMAREFYIDGLSSSIELYEPSLTADSLGLKTWGSSLLLAQRFAKQHESVILGTDRQILELGSGTGLVGIVLGMLGYSVLMTDLNEIVPNLQHNLQLNSLKSETKNDLQDVTAEVLDWMHIENSETYIRGDKFATIVLSDPIYSSAHPPMIANVVKTFLEYENICARVIVQIPIREKFADVRALFWQALSDAGLCLCAFEQEVGRDDFGEGFFLWTMWQPQGRLSRPMHIDINTLP
ncbi:putative methyltransferase-domain-containing protein [Lipomyces arxii]|uniref:putative methyltransferase-domain-containing protein n=1 Tax=Lipomyces arxii TaxID=56418 RepID=UPI0034CF8D36